MSRNKNNKKNIKEEKLVINNEPNQLLVDHEEEPEQEQGAAEERNDDESSDGKIEEEGDEIEQEPEQEQVEVAKTTEVQTDKVKVLAKVNMQYSQNEVLVAGETCFLSKSSYEKLSKDKRQAISKKLFEEV